MIEAEAGAATVGIPKVIPESVNLLPGVKISHGVRPTLSKQMLENRADLRSKKCVIDPAFRFVDVEVGG